jgi:hypothetical protein
MSSTITNFMSDNCSLLSVAAFILVFILVMKMLRQPKKESFKDKLGLSNIYCGNGTCEKGAIYNFEHKLPARRYNDLVREFGEPTVLADEPNGFAIWKSPDYFQEVILRDESIKHAHPKPHCDFLYATIRVHIPDDLISQVMSITPTLSYDKLKQELTSRCSFMGANVVALHLALKVLDNASLLHNIKLDYPKMIMEVGNDWNYKIVYDQLKDEVRNNQMKYSLKFPKKGCLIPY